MTFTLTPDQQNAYQAFDMFLADNTLQAMVISGYAGTGKSTLVRSLINDLPALLKTHQMLDPSMPKYDVYLTATTNKAAIALSHATGHQTITIHSLLGLIPSQTGGLRLTRNTEAIDDALIFIDEASYIDPELFRHIEMLTENSKVIFIGDPAQLPPVKSGRLAVWQAGLPEVRLTNIVRQSSDSPIIDLAHTFRAAVYNEPTKAAHECDGEHILHLPREDFEAMLLADCSRPNWDANHSRYLAYSNAAVCHYNREILSKVEGRRDLNPGDIAVVNSFCKVKGKSVKADSVHEIISMEPAQEFGFPGWYVTLDGKFTAFMPESIEVRKQALKKYQDKLYQTAHINDEWLDLRPAFCSTIHKSQGSTYDRVYIDLDDLRTARLGHTMRSRLLYVAISRARHQVVLTGQVAKETDHAQPEERLSA